MMLSAGSSISSGLWMPLLAMLGIALLLIQLRRHQFRTTTARDVTREQFARLRDQRGVQQAMDQLLLQLEDLSRRINAQADTKFLKLETVIRDADDRIARLERLLEQLKQLRTPNPGSIDTRQPKDVDVGCVPDAPSSKPSDVGCVTNAPSSSTSSARDGDASESADPAAPADPRVGRVHALADAGQQPIKIAEELDMPLGEVEFILNLRDFR